ELGRRLRGDPEDCAAGRLARSAILARRGPASRLRNAGGLGWLAHLLGGRGGGALAGRGRLARRGCPAGRGRRALIAAAVRPTTRQRAEHVGGAFVAQATT